MAAANDRAKRNRKFEVKITILAEAGIVRI